MVIQFFVVHYLPSIVLGLGQVSQIDIETITFQMITGENFQICISCPTLRYETQGKQVQLLTMI